MNSRELASISSLWNRLLTRINQTSLSLQKIDIDLNNVVNLYNSLIDFITFLRNSEETFLEIEADGEMLSGNEDYEQDSKRTKKRKRQHGENDTEVMFNGSDKFKSQTFYVILDVLNSELRKRKNAYTSVYENFNFLFNLPETPDEEIIISVNNIIKTYPEDLDNSFIDECIQFKDFLIAVGLPDSACDSPKNYSEKLLNIIVSNNVCSTFPNMETILRIFGSMAVSNCTGERSFSVLKRVKNYLRSSQSDERVSNLAILSIESEMLYRIEDELVIEKFANFKARKAPL